MKYYIDIDLTICNSTIDGIISYPNATPIYENIKKINILYEQGHEITYWTARGRRSGKNWRELTEQQLYLWGAKYTYLDTETKPDFDVLVDDKAISINDL